MKVILFTTLLFFSINGFTFNWKKVAEDEDGHSLYVDVDSIKNHNGFVYYWQLTDFLNHLVLLIQQLIKPKLIVEKKY